MYPGSGTKPRRRPQLGSSSSPQHNAITPSSSRSQLHSTSRDHSNIRQEITDEQRHEIKEAFELFDTDKDGYIDYHELKVPPPPRPPQSATEVVLTFAVGSYPGVGIRCQETRGVEDFTVVRVGTGVTFAGGIYAYNDRVYSSAGSVGRD